MNEGRVLVVEDEPSIREVVSLYLRRAGYQVTVVEDGQAALDSLAGQLPDFEDIKRIITVFVIPFSGRCVSLEKP